MATTGAQTAAAQDDVDCDHVRYRWRDDVTSGTDASDTMCNAVGDEATVEFTGDSTIR